MAGAKSRETMPRQGASSSSFKRVLVAVDGSENSMRAARVAVEMAQKYEAELMVLHVIPATAYGTSLSGFDISPPPSAYEKYHEYERSIGESLVGPAVDIAKASSVRVKAERARVTRFDWGRNHSLRAGRARRPNRHRNQGSERV